MVRATQGAPETGLRIPVVTDTSAEPTSWTKHHTAMLITDATTVATKVKPNMPRRNGQRACRLTEPPL